MLHDNNLIEMSLRLNRSEPIFRTIRELPGIGKRPRTRDDIRLRRNLPFSFTVVWQKPSWLYGAKKITNVQQRLIKRSQIVFSTSAVLYKTYLKNTY